MTAAKKSRKTVKSVWPEFMRYPWARALAALVLVLAIGMVFNPEGVFYRWGTHRDMFRQIAVPGILACGMTLVIIAGGIDLAVGSVLGFVAVLFSLLTLHLGWSGWAAVPVCIAAGLAAGTLSGSVISVFGVQPFVATLAMMVFARGLAKYLSGGQKISQAVQTATGDYKYVDLPRAMAFLDSKILGENIAVVTLVLLLSLGICHALLNHLRWGRYFYSVGGNEEASRLSGVPVAGTKLAAYALSGLFAAVAGICQAAQEHQGDPEAGMGYELTAIAIVVIGGTSLAGGKGSTGLTLLGALIIGYLEKILSVNAVGEASRLMLTGAIIVGAVLFQKTRSR
ncbi:MAG TPA: ABC transporter permease [Bdellovibrionota bacterium]|nr:ABC transporter permease [Bdellovibrionota bacterium]